MEAGRMRWPYGIIEKTVVKHSKLIVAMVMVGVMMIMVVVVIVMIVFTAPMLV
jgi:hypothetical protein